MIEQFNRQPTKELRDIRAWKKANPALKSNVLKGKKGNT